MRIRHSRMKSYRYPMSLQEIFDLVSSRVRKGSFWNGIPLESDMLVRDPQSTLHSGMGTCYDQAILVAWLITNFTTGRRSKTVYVEDMLGNRHMVSGMVHNDKVSFVETYREDSLGVTTVNLRDIKSYLSTFLRDPNTGKTSIVYVNQEVDVTNFYIGTYKRTMETLLNKTGSLRDTISLNDVLTYDRGEYGYVCKVCYKDGSSIYVKPY